MSGANTQQRPVVVLTGMGLVTALGAGKSENWQKLVAGQSGISKITRFGVQGLKTSIAGTIDFLLPPGFRAPELSYALAEFSVSEALAQAMRKSSRWR